MFVPYTNMTESNISFTSNIRFINYKKFNRKYKRTINIGFHHDESNIRKDNQFRSTNIRTCTGGGLVTPNVEAAGFHFWDDITNDRKFPLIMYDLFRFVEEPERALLIGGKDLKENPFSIKQFQKFKETFLDNIKNVSIFGPHKHKFAESHYHYSLDTDTWTIASTYLEKQDKRLITHSVENLFDLLDFFEQISIAKGDRLFFGKQEILPQDCPDIFVDLNPLIIKNDNKFNKLIDTLAKKFFQ